MKFSIRNILLVFLVITLAGCRFNKLRKTGTWQEKYKAALNYYEEKDYYRSNILFEEILPIIRGTKEAELANFYYPYTYFYQDQYILSAHYFKTFAEVYSRSEYAMEAEYMHAYSLYMQSPDFELDQTVTYEAIAALQLFINRYPYSEYSDQADELINELQVKLEKKAFENAKLYQKISRYKAALVAFDNFRVNYPDSKYNDEALYLSVKTAYEFATVSIRSKQEERFQKAVDYYEELVDNFPESNFLADAEAIYAKSIEELTSFAVRNKES